MKKIIIPQEEVNYLQKLNYEIEARKNLCQFLIRQNIRNKAFDDYHNEYIELLAEYELAKLELQNNYIKPVIGNQTCNWNLDFQTNEVNIDVIS